MKKVVLIFSLIIIAISVNAYNIPQFTNYVVDEGDLLTGQEENQLNAMLKAYQDSTSTQIAVLTLTSFDDENEGSLFDFSMDIFKNWKLGQKSKKNGVLLVVVQNLASKRAPGLRIATGYGMEGPLPDAICKRIIENIRPSINEGQYYQGISTGVASIISQIKGEYTADKSNENNNDFMMIVLIGFGIILVSIFFVILLFSARESTRDNSSYGSSYGRRSSSTTRRSSSNSDYTTYSTPSSYTDSGSSSSDSGSSFDGGGGGDSGGGGAGD